MGAQTSDPWLNTTLDGKYRILEKIADGGMGAVYKAEHILMGRTVAVKVLRPDLVDQKDSEQFLDRFKQEAKTASSIQHPNAIIIHDYGVFDDAPYLVMQLIDGVSLGFLISEHGPMTPERSAAILQQVCAAISEAHASGVVHRDLKPDNIMISTRRDGTDAVVVLDFGIAKILGRTGDTSLGGLTQTGMIVGTPKYMSPEQIKGEKIDGRSDIYSLGAILYEMLSGREPHEAESPMHMMVKILNDQPVPLRSRRSDVPAEIEQVVMNALEKDPANRYQTVADFMHALREAAGGRSVTGSGRNEVFTLGDSSAASWSENRPPIRRADTRSLFTGTLVNGIAMLLVLGGGVYWLTRPPGPLDDADVPALSAGSTEADAAVSVIAEAEAKGAELRPAAAERSLSDGSAAQEAALAAELQAASLQQQTSAPADEVDPKSSSEEAPSGPNEPKEQSMTIDELIAQLRSGNREKRVAASDELTARGAEAVEPLVAALSQPDTRVRFWSANVLGRLKSPEAVAPLIAMLDDPSDVVYDSVVGALERIGNADARKALDALNDSSTTLVNSSNAPEEGGVSDKALARARRALMGGGKAETGPDEDALGNAASQSSARAALQNMPSLPQAAGSSDARLSANPADSEPAAEEQPQQTAPGVSSLHGGDSFRELLSQAQSAVDSSQFEIALGAYEQAAGLRPKDTFVQNRLGWLYNKLGRYNEAVNALKRASELNPDSTAAYINLGNAYLKLQRYQDAIGPLTKALKLEPDNASGHLTAANAYTMVRDYREAVKHFESAAKLEPSKASTFYGLAYAHERLGQSDEAVKAYKECVRLDPQFTKGHAGLGKSLLNARRYGEAIDALNRAIAIEGTADLQYSLGLAYERSSSRSKAAKAYQAALKLSPGNAAYQAALERVR